MTKTIKWPMGQPMEGSMLQELGELLDSGEIIVYPTNTLYGIGASIFSSAGVSRVHQVKERPDGDPFLIMANESQIRELCHINDLGERFLERKDILVTGIFDAKDTAPSHIIHNGTLAVRLPCSVLAASIMEYAGPITSTSANIHGGRPPSTCRSAEEQLGEKVRIYIDSGPVNGQPTTLVDFTGVKPKIIREGALPSAAVGEYYG